MPTDPPPPRRPERLRNISRVDSDALRGWLVRFQRSGDKTSRFFNDRTHGGTDSALDAATEWRDDSLRRLGPPQPSDASQMLTPEARQKNRQSVSRTGVTGINYKLREFASQNVPYVTAYWIDTAGQRRQTSYSVQQHGLDSALRLAAQARARTAEWHGQPAMTAEEIFDAAIGPIRKLAARHMFAKA